MSGQHETREAWLTAGVAALTPLFTEQAMQVPPVRVSVGWPKGRGGKGKIIGQCWHTGATTDGVQQIFISPELDEATRVLDVLMHEVLHAVDDGESKHRGHFAKMAARLGLEKPWTATTAGEDLAFKLQAISEGLGEYPHSALTQAAVAAKKQTTRMIKVECPDCGYTVRTTKKWLDVGAPWCPTEQRPMQFELPDEGEGEEG